MEKKPGRGRGNQKIIRGVKKMNDINRVVVIGRLTRDPELKILQSGTTAADLSIAVNESQKKGDEWTDYANFFNVTAWGKTADNCGKYLTKGRQIVVEGRLHQDRWEKDGVKHNTVKIIAESVQFIGKSGGSEQAAAPANEDDIPF